MRKIKLVTQGVSNASDRVKILELRQIIAQNYLDINNHMGNKETCSFVRKLDKFVYSILMRSLRSYYYLNQLLKLECRRCDLISRGPFLKV